MVRKLNEMVKYIGVDDIDLDLFENQYYLPHGMAYNSYLILDEKVALLDTTDSRTSGKWKDALLEGLEGRVPDYLIIQHLEPDHSALIKWVIERFPNITLVGSARVFSMLPQFFEDIELHSTLTVKDGDILDLGTHKLQFFTAPMVHWPEVIVSYDITDEALYSADAFGKFGALSECGFYGSEDVDWAAEARRYYFNIVGKYGVQVQTLLKKCANLKISRIRPLHGPMLEYETENYLELYDIWSSYRSESEGVFVICASIHGGTMKAAEYIVEKLQENGEMVTLCDLCHCDISESIGNAFKHSRLVLCASSYDGSLFTPMYNFLHILQLKGFCKRKVAIVENGSWAPSAGRVMKEMLSCMKDIEIVEPMVTLKSTMKSTDKELLDNLIENI
ncbi:MAG TPA: flavodoxin [Rikenellaceae bacterium]|nr:flavodoxin [Rikenellaceae bacterium]